MGKFSRGEFRWRVERCDLSIFWRRIKLSDVQSVNLLCPVVIEPLSIGDILEYMLEEH